MESDQIYLQYSSAWKKISHSCHSFIQHNIVIVQFLVLVQVKIIKYTDSVTIIAFLLPSKHKS